MLAIYLLSFDMFQIGGRVDIIFVSHILLVNYENKTKSDQHKQSSSPPGRVSFPPLVMSPADELPPPESLLPPPS